MGRVCKESQSFRPNSRASGTLTVIAAVFLLPGVALLLRSQLAVLAPSGRQRARTPSVGVRV
jgi:hypothetical protein